MHWCCLQLELLFSNHISTWFLPGHHASAASAESHHADYGHELGGLLWGSLLLSPGQSESMSTLYVPQCLLPRIVCSIACLSSHQRRAVTFAATSFATSTPTAWVHSQIPASRACHNPPKGRRSGRSPGPRWPPEPFEGGIPGPWRLAPAREPRTLLARSHPESATGGAANRTVAARIGRLQWLPDAGMWKGAISG